MAAPVQPLMPPRLSPTRARRLLDGVRAVLFDCDGVLWEGERALPGAREVVGALQARGGPSAAIFVSNNSRRSREELGQRFRVLGFLGVSGAEVYTSGHCAARYLRYRLLGGRLATEGEVRGSRGTDGEATGHKGTQGKAEELQGTDGETGGVQGTEGGTSRGTYRSGQWEQGLPECPHESSHLGNQGDQDCNKGPVETESHQSTAGRPQDQELGVYALQDPESTGQPLREQRCPKQGLRGEAGMSLPVHGHGIAARDPLTYEGKNQTEQGYYSRDCTLQGRDGAYLQIKDCRHHQGDDSTTPLEEHPSDPQPGAPLVFVIGGAGLHRELLDAGLRVLGEEDTNAAVRAVLVGYDEEFTFRKLSRACTYLRDPDCLLVATDRDPWHLLSGGRCTPGTGSLVAAVETAAARPAIVVGKPSLFMFKDILAQHKIDPSCTLMVGDRLEVDIQFGRNCGLTSILTLTGVSQLTDVQAYAQSDSPAQRRLVPDFYVESIADLLPGLEGTEGEL